MIIRAKLAQGDDVTQERFDILHNGRQGPDFELKKPQETVNIRENDFSTLFI